ncbi:MAG: P-loop NTPase [Deltaproteobacteria bacterium]|nr:P-loop NTPase [Deltaproteobacteria bacterium]MCW5804137.1 P-loop NTPase [Deltaproteobacteria bacterium]
MSGPRKPPPRIVAIAGGKGGVGKSTIAANLALAIGRLGLRTVIVDADLGAANLHTMFGALHPERTLADFFDQRVADLAPLVTQVAPTVGLVAGTSRPGSANLAGIQRLRLLRAIGHLDTDVAILDVGAGTSFNVVDLVAAADHKLFVMTPSLPSLHNAYALMKACVHRVVRKLSHDETEQGLIDAALGAETKARTIPQLLGVLRPLDAYLADRIVDTLLRFGVGMVANLVGNDADVAALGRMSPLIYDHLLVHAPLVATLRRTGALAGGLRAGAGTLTSHADESYAVFARLASAIAGTDLARLRGEQRAALAQTLPLWVTRTAGEEQTP